MPGSVIVGGARTPIGKLSGALKGFTAMDLGGFATSAALAVGVAACAVKVTLSSVVSGWPGGSGSSANTSSPACAIRRSRSAARRAASPRIAPRAVLMKIAPGLIIPMRRASRKPFTTRSPATPRAMSATAMASAIRCRSWPRPLKGHRRRSAPLAPRRHLGAERLTTGAGRSKQQRSQHAKSQDQPREPRHEPGLVLSLKFPRQCRQ